MKKKIDPRDFQLTGNARRGHTYFVTGNAVVGYQWMLAAPNDDTLASSEMFAKKADCMRVLRAVQRHGASTHVLDEADL